ncbi:MAG: LPP20 family lipoprotein [Burkholderiaceae bacterium]
MKISIAAVFATVLIASGCSTVVPKPTPGCNAAVRAPVPVSNYCSTVPAQGLTEYPGSREYKTLRLSAVGYGAASSFDGYSAGQKRLLAMRASKLDAYRALAEQVYGIRIAGNTTVTAMAAQSDSFRVYIDAYLRGARVLTVTPMAEGNYETVIEMDFDEHMVNDYLVQTPVASVPANYQNGVLKGITGSGRAYGTSFYYAD